MKKELSFTKLQKSMMHEMRQKLSCCGKSPDLISTFTMMGTKLLRKAFEKSDIPIAENDLIFSTESGHHFNLSGRLLASPAFMQTWEHSDLPAIIERFAGLTYHRMVHLKNTATRVNLKMHN